MILWQTIDIADGQDQEHEYEEVDLNVNVAKEQKSEVQRLEDVIADWRERFEALAREQKQLQTRFDAVNQQNQTVTEDKQKLQTQLNAVQAEQLKQLQENDAKWQAQVDAISDEKHALQTQLDAVHAEPQHKGDDAKLQAQVDVLNNDKCNLQIQLEAVKQENQSVKQKLHEMTMGSGIETAFIKEEDFLTLKWAPFTAQTLPNLLETTVDKLSEEQYADLEGDDEEEDSEETRPRFDLLMERVASEFLFDVLVRCKRAMEERKTAICQVIASTLHVNGAESVRAMVEPQLQQQWEHHLRAELRNVHDIEVPALDKVLEGIFEGVVQAKPKWAFLKGAKYARSSRVFIEKGCEIAWIMILSKPEMSFFPESFRQFYGGDGDGDGTEEEQDAGGGHDLWPGSSEESEARAVFFATPAILQRHFADKDKQLQIIKGKLFAHHDPGLIEYIVTDPEELLLLL